MIDNRRYLIVVTNETDPDHLGGIVRPCNEFTITPVQMGREELRRIVYDAIVKEATWFFKEKQQRAFELGRELMALDEDHGEWHAVLDDFNFDDRDIELCLEQIGPESHNPELGREFGALMLSMDLEAREPVMDLLQDFVPKADAVALADAVLKALEGKTP